ncbi:hypothetical protein BIV23_44310 [Streptomyces monashensis]|uniref:Rhodanese domain-containing protein n=1 Tax=Streptomyces monashensis TaxID=1678012 RepID=A0A1S2NW86_9ACTN|nr:hypothetical protein BIV23_44310 [Streptomyces monashensis]
MPHCAVGAEEVTREEPNARVAAGGVVVLDARPAEEHRAGHIPGALSIPAGELADRDGELPEEAGSVVRCRGGMPEWRLAELPVDTADLT